MSRNAKNRILCSVGVIAAASVFGAAAARGASLTNSISNNNSTVTFTYSTSTTPVPFVTDWVVDGVDQYGGTPAGGESLLVAIGNGDAVYLNTLPVESSFFSGALATVVYQGSGYTATVKDILAGGSPGSGVSALTESVDINNTSDAGLPLTFATFVRPNVNATPTGQTLNLGTNSASVTDASGTTFNYGVTPTPDLLSESTDAGADYFDVSPGIFKGTVGFAYTWGNISDPTAVTIGVGGSESFSFTETVSGVPSAAPVVPLPSAAQSALATLAGLAVIGVVRRMRKANA
ncbi:MAG: hypothetical protein ABSC42_00455 [Tepidisphaeraceae bacterium]|jgi:hypothetical protein